MKRLLYLFPLLLIAISTVNAQELIPLTENPAIQRYLFELEQQLPKAWRNRSLVTEKNNCQVENPNETYVTIGKSVAIKIEIDTSGLGEGAAIYSCTNCQNAEFGTASVANDTLFYTASAIIEAGKDNITVELCKGNNCRSRTYRIVARRPNRVHFQTPIMLSPEGIANVIANASLLPGRKAICNSFVDCKDNYQGRNQEVFFTTSEPNGRVTYKASRYAGIDSVCVVMCDTFAVCDTFKFAFQIRSDTLNLPFMDDFSYPGPYPAASHWLDRDAFVNYDMAINPPSLGVVTFDGLDAKGTSYGGGYGEADWLTSKYLNFSGAGSNVVLTYWLQRRGFGDKPEPQDSMILEFKDRNGKWIRMQGYGGIPVSQPNTVEEPFRFYAQPIPNEFKYNGFQFRFKNYSERTGILDVWHLDYVRVDDNFVDSIFADIAFTRLPNFILEKYTSMPWWHFEGNEANELRDSIKVGLWNHGNQPQPTNASRARLREVQTNVELFDPIPTLFNGLQANIPNGVPLNRSYSLIQDMTGFPSVWADYLQIMSGPVFDNLDRQEFLLEYSLINTSQVNTPGYEAVGRNDAVRRYTYFDNYFSYDDGTAEAGLIAQENVSIAVEYTANVPDSLRAIQFHFPRTTIDVSDQSFNLQVWVGELDNTPEYEQILLRPLYTDIFFDTLQGFTTYVLVDENNQLQPLYLPAGKFYIGWQQITPCDGTKCIPVGYDRNTPEGLQYLFFNRNQTWSPFPQGFAAGAAMLRPVVGSVTPPPTTSTDEKFQPDKNFNIFPNPARSVLNIQPLEGYYEDFHFQAFSATGQLLAQGILSSQLDVSNFPAGLYFLKIIERQSNRIWNEKFIIAK